MSHVASVEYSRPKNFRSGFRVHSNKKNVLTHYTRLIFFIVSATLDSSDVLEYKKRVKKKVTSTVKHKM